LTSESPRAAAPHDQTKDEYWIDVAKALARAHARADYLKGVEAKHE
jgi:hypothetical protein